MMMMMNNAEETEEQRANDCKGPCLSHRSPCSQDKEIESRKSITTITGVIYKCQAVSERLMYTVSVKSIYFNFTTKTKNLWKLPRTRTHMQCKHAIITSKQDCFQTSNPLTETNEMPKKGTETRKDRALQKWGVSQGEDDNRLQNK